jgi:phage terminase large subunit
MSINLSTSRKNYLIKLLRQRDKDKIPPILKPLWQPYRKKMITGGRGSAKTQTACRILIRQASNYKLRCLFAREIMESIKESLWAELSVLIPFLGYPGWVINEKKIYNKKTGSQFIFKGLRDIKQARSMKGYARFDRLIMDEAEAIPKDSLIMAVPTIREPGSEVWGIFNRYEDLDPINELYCTNPRLKTYYQNGYQYRTDGKTLVIECNYTDNPWFPDVLKGEMEDMREDDYDLYLHVWENHPIAQLEKALMDRVLVDIAMKTILPADGPQVIGVDIARHGMDKSKAYETRGCKSKKIGEAKHSEPIKFAREIAHKADNPYIMINVDNGGLGAGGFIDRLRELGFKNVNEINFGGTPKNKKKYANVITEAYFECKEKLIDADIPNDRHLKQDFTGRLFGYDLKTRKRLEKKEDFRKRYHRSPDDGDALVLSKYDPGKKIKMTSEEKRQRREAVKRRRARNRRRFLV